MRKMFVFIVLAWLLMTNATSALTITEAQKCSDRLLEAYNSRSYPGKMLMLEAITQRTFGMLYRSMTNQEKAEATRATKRVLRESFEHPTGQYQYKDLVVGPVETTKHGFRINGTVHITSPKYTGTASFMALVYPGCKVEQARIGNIYALDIALREMLKKESKWRDILG